MYVLIMNIYHRRYKHINIYKPELHQFIVHKIVIEHPLPYDNKPTPALIVLYKKQ